MAKRQTVYISYVGFYQEDCIKKCKAKLFRLYLLVWRHFMVLCHVLTFKKIF